MGENIVDDTTTEKVSHQIHNIITNNIHQLPTGSTDYTNWIIVIVLLVALVVAIGGAAYCFIKLQKCKDELITPPTNSETSAPPKVWRYRENFKKNVSRFWYVSVKCEPEQIDPKSEILKEDSLEIR
jgi:ABC-type glycerol-3-phosphate transport system permease component